MQFVVKQVTTGPFALFKALESCVEHSDYTHLYRGTDFGDGDDAMQLFGPQTLQAEAEIIDIC